VAPALSDMRRAMCAQSHPMTADGHGFAPSSLAQSLSLDTAWPLALQPTDMAASTSQSGLLRAQRSAYACATVRCQRSAVNRDIASGQRLQPSTPGGGQVVSRAINFGSFSYHDQSSTMSANAEQSALSRRGSVTDEVTRVTILTRRALRGSNLAQVCDERATFSPHGNATFVA
jgi:hypothetical protein